MSTTTSRSEVGKDVAEEARAAGLRYINDERPGISRLGEVGKFRYVDAKGKVVKDAETLGRIRGLVIPPAWKDVWISPVANGHIQATGRDARGRKQYRYHPDWRSRRDEAKFQHMLAFARALPKIRRRVKRDLRKDNAPRLKVLATVVRLLEVTLIRVGNDEYAKKNGSYGLTTMRKKHVKVKGMRVSFSFRGKSGKRHEIGLEDKQMAKMVKRCQDLPGQELFGYVDENGAMRDIGSQDVNAYLREIAGADFTAKDFRTWSGTVLAAMALKEFEQVTSQNEARKNIVAAIEAVAKMLGNTPTVCRKCYVHPEILNSYLEGATTEMIQQRISPKMPHLRQLKPDEAAVFVLLQRRLKDGDRKSRVKVGRKVRPNR
ncbi:DNA topoisomerase IB [Phragmitibacter flavus]|uniref:DNA topoisomerase n=1 Tax=Phragmitibacter flavus TaxID=2576071 RepID=A0A5R8KDP9_9BACT|nr:DNA topoisomerase IB [Phragmitibacter flavus]TLD70377.1 DNA topoisomerase IB [Phragmitibacter flavus]